MAGLALLAAALVFLELPFVSGVLPLLARLGKDARVGLYEQITPVAGALLGFIVAAVAILVSFDSRRQIVKELKLGESFSLLIANMLAAIVLLFVVTVMGLVGPVIDGGGKPAGAYETIYELVVLTTVFELVLTGVLFSVATYKVAAANTED